MHTFLRLKKDISINSIRSNLTVYLPFLFITAQSVIVKYCFPLSHWNERLIASNDLNGFNTRQRKANRSFVMVSRKAMSAEYI